MLVLRICFIALLTTVVIAGCSSKGNQFYKHQPSNPPLEVPPDLTLVNTGSGFDIPQIAQVKQKKINLGEDGTVELKKDGRLRWLEVTAPVDVLWEEVKNFWISNHVEVKWHNVALGIMETDWINSYDSKYSKDRFRVRLEPGEKSGVTELYLIHRGMQSTMVNGEVLEGWAETYNDPELEIEVMGDLLMFLGLSEERKSAILDDTKEKTESAKLNLKASPPNIVMAEPLERAWRFVSQAIGRSGNVITQQDKNAGWMEVRLERSSTTSDFVPGFALSNEDREVFRLQLKEEGKSTQIIVLNNQGQPDYSEQAKSFLETIHNYF